LLSLELPALRPFICLLIVSLAVFIAGGWFFKFTKRSFADVL